MFRIGRPRRSDLFRGHRIHFTYSGRGALTLLFRSAAKEARERREVLLPAFHCPTVVEPVLQAGLAPRFYRIQPDLSVDEEDFRQKLTSKVLAAVAINYFGFPTPLDGLSQACSQSGTLLVEDCAHSFICADDLTLMGERADAAIYSFKKIVPSLVGGGIRVNNNRLAIDEATRRQPLRQWAVNYKALIDQGAANLSDGPVRAAYFGLDRLQAKLRSPARPESSIEQPAPSASETAATQYGYESRLETARIPRAALRAVRNADYADIVQRRRENYSIYQRALSGSRSLRPVFGALPQDVCPWGYPVFIENRNRHDQVMRARGVRLFTFGETLHEAFRGDSSLSSSLVEATRYLADSVLCLSVQQGLTKQRITDSAETVLSVTG